MSDENCYNCVSCGAPACRTLVQLVPLAQALAEMCAPPKQRPASLGVNRREQTALDLLKALEKLR